MKATLIRITAFPAHTGLANHQSTSLLLDLTAEVKKYMAVYQFYVV